MPDIRVGGRLGADYSSLHADEAHQKTTDRQDGTGIDLSSPVIYFGTSREVAPRQSNKEQHFVRASDDKSLAALSPMTKEAKLLTLYIAGIPSYLDDASLEKLFKAVAKLQSWKQVFSGTGVAMPYGFATYEEPDSLARACAILSSLRLPVTRGSEDFTKLTISQDPVSKLYMEDYQALKKSATTDTKDRNMLLSATGQAEKLIKDFNNMKFNTVPDRQESKLVKIHKDSEEPNVTNSVTIMLSIEDELGDIPEEQRASIATEISSFRERSARRDQERARQIAEVELRRLEYERANRSDTAKKIPAQEQCDAITLIRRQEATSERTTTERMSEQEIAARRRRSAEAEANLLYIKEENAWLAREAPRIASLKHEVSRMEDANIHYRVEKSYLLEKFEKFDDDKAAYQSSEEFYKDRVAWSRARAVIRKKEMEQDTHEALLNGQMSEFHSTLKNSINAPIVAVEAPAPVRLALARAPEDIRRKPTTTKEVMLEDDDQQIEKRVLVPLQFDEIRPTTEVSERSSSTSSPRLTAVANSVPFSKTELWKQPVKWHLLDAQILEKLRSFVSKKIVDVLGLEEDDLISAIMSIIHARKSGQDIEQELEAAIGDSAESEVTAIKIWRFLILSLEMKEQ